MKLTHYANRITCGYFVLLFSLALLPLNGKDSSINKTYIHTLGDLRLDYFLHGMLLVPWMSFRVLYPHLEKENAVVWLLTGLLLAISLEGVQYFLPYRTYNVKDLTANVIGLLMGIPLWLVAVFLVRMYKKTSGK